VIEARVRHGPTRVARVEPIVRVLRSQSMTSPRIVATLALSLLLVACDQNGTDPDAGHGGEGACGDIVEACHTVDTGTGEIAVCHDIGHDEDHAMCEARRDECVALCEAAHDDGGTHHDEDGGTHHDEDGGPPDLCDELGSLCHPYDTGSGPGHECHEIGHAGDLPACEAAEAMCRTVCSGDAGPAHGHDEDAGT
jgi:hypothetical protein